MWRTIINNPQILIAILVVLGPLLGRIFKTLNEQAAKRRQLIALERTKIEALRTGGRMDQGANTVRTTQGPAVSARAALEELAARRRSELSRPQSSAPSDGSMQNPMPRQDARPAPKPARPVAPQRNRTPVSIEQSVQQSAERPVGRSAATRSRAAAPSTPVPATAASGSSSARAAASRAAAAVKDAARRNEGAYALDRGEGLDPVTTSTPAGQGERVTRRSQGQNTPVGLDASGLVSADSLRRASHADWKRAFVMLEIMGTPVGMR